MLEQLVPESRQIYTHKTSARLGIQPEGVLFHYTAGADRPLLPRLKVWAENERKASTDYVIGRDGNRYLLRGKGALFERYTWHSGGSVWLGANNLSAVMRQAGFAASFSANPEKRTNLFMLGLDLDNYGYLDEYNGQAYYRRSKKQRKAGKKRVPFPGPVFRAADGQLWEDYTPLQIESAQELVYGIAQHCSRIADRLRRDATQSATKSSVLTGHENVRVTKSDPGPAFERQWAGMFNAARGHYASGAVCE